MSVENVPLHNKLLNATERFSRTANHGVYTPTHTGEDLPLTGTPTTGSLTNGGEGSILRWQLLSEGRVLLTAKSCGFKEDQLGLVLLGQWELCSCLSWR